MNTDDDPGYVDDVPNMPVEYDTDEWEGWLPPEVIRADEDELEARWIQ